MHYLTVLEIHKSIVRDILPSCTAESVSEEHDNMPVEVFSIDSDHDPYHFMGKLRSASIPFNIIIDNENVENEADVKAVFRLLFDEVGEYLKPFNREQIADVFHSIPESVFDNAHTDAEIAEAYNRHRAETRVISWKEQLQQLQQLQQFYDSNALLPKEFLTRNILSESIDKIRQEIARSPNATESDGKVVLAAFTLALKYVPEQALEDLNMDLGQLPFAYCARHKLGACI